MQVIFAAFSGAGIRDFDDSVLELPAVKLALEQYGVQSISDSGLAQIDSDGMVHRRAIDVLNGDGEVLPT